MKKYDCNKTLDYAHELGRMCDSHTVCVGEDRECPMRNSGCDFSMNVSREQIAIVQKWSDEHPEPPKIRRREFSFIAMFKWADEKWIERCPDGSLRFVTKNEVCDLCDAWFSFIEKGESMTFEELLKLEIED